jgi:acetyl esterase/lipase
MKSILLAVWLAVLATHAGTQADPIQVNLWPGTPSANPEDNSSITAYLPDKDKASAAGVIVVPGGSFLIRCEDHEGTQVAKWLTAQGIAAFVVHYRLIPRFTMREELDDVRRAVQVVRSRSQEFGVHKIGVIGFSAGAYLAGEAALKPWESNRSADDPIEKSDSHLDFMALVYGAPGGTNDPINGFNRFFADQVGLEPWRKLTATTLNQIAQAPPAFMFCTVEDRGAARRMGEFHLQLLQQGVSTEAHFFASGPHGVGLAQADPILGEWPHLFLNWMRSKEFLLEQKSLPVSGLVRINGQAIELGYVVFQPRGPSSYIPLRTAYIFNRSGEKGAFHLPEGLAPGEYDATVYQMAATWKSVWAEPLLTGIQSKLNHGEKLSRTEISGWKDWAAARRYEPTLPDLAQLQTIRVQVTPENAGNLLIDVAK